MNKSKGTNAERALVHKFWSTGEWVCHRIAGSGSSKYPSPDLIASNKIRRLSIECKTTRTGYVYIPKEEIFALREFSQMFGAEPWVALKFLSEEWLFLNIDDLNETGKSFKADKKLAKSKGLLFEELVK